MDSNIQKNRDSKIISPVGLLLLLLKVRRRLETQDDNVSRLFAKAIIDRTSPRDILKALQSLCSDNCSTMIDLLGEDLFNDVNEIKDIPGYHWQELTRNRDMFIYTGGRSSGRTNLYLHFSKSKIGKK